MTDREQSFIECEAIGAVKFTDSEGNKFYGGVRVNGLEILRFDSVKILLDEPDCFGESVAHADVLAVFDDGFGDGMYVEVRWYQNPREVAAFRKKKITQLPNELIESSIIDNIPAGSIIGVIDILAPTISQSSDRSAPSLLSSMGKLAPRASHFVCRFYEKNPGDASLTPVDVTSRNIRSAALSEYRSIYRRAMHETDLDADPSAPSDIYTTAIRRLHVSVLPDTLPCRTEQKEKIMAYLRDGIAKGGNVRPLYISGMPGTGRTPFFLFITSYLF